jgi:hypothetical protein
LPDIGTYSTSGGVGTDPALDHTVALKSLESPRQQLQLVLDCPFGAAPTARIFNARDAIIAHKICAKSDARHSKGIKNPHCCTMIGESGKEGNISVDAP